MYWKHNCCVVYTINFAQYNIVQYINYVTVSIRQEVLKLNVEILQFNFAIKCHKNKFFEIIVSCSNLFCLSITRNSQLSIV